uniref:CARD domain-containing protein n=1 Tax=Mastacembelus armatus TaxID=205130 RepID=A0A7N8YE76_9TELE
MSAEILSSVRTQFVQKVSEPVLNQLLDFLLQQDVINQGEMESKRAKTRADRARAVIDMVRGKGTEANSVEQFSRVLRDYFNSLIFEGGNDQPQLF